MNGVLRGVKSARSWRPPGKNSSPTEKRQCNRKISKSLFFEAFEPSEGCCNANFHFSAVLFVKEQ